MTAPERTWETSRLLAKPAAVADTQVIFDDYAWLVHPNMSEAPRDCLCYSIVKAG